MSNAQMPGKVLPTVCVVGKSKAKAMANKLELQVCGGKTKGQGVGTGWEGKVPSTAFNGGYGANNNCENRTR